MSQNDLETRLDELETRLAFQDDVINTLSEQVARQEMDIRELWEAKRLLHKQLKDVHRPISSRSRTKRLLLITEDDE